MNNEKKAERLDLAAEALNASMARRCGGVSLAETGAVATMREVAKQLRIENAELLTIARDLVFAADAKLLSERHRVVERARAAIAKADGN